MLGLDGSVGKNGQNKRHDVAVIQVALKSIKSPEHKPLYGGPIDGEFGRHRQVLEAAISLFQRHSRIPVTGRIDRMGPAMNRLEMALPSALRGMKGVPGTAVVAVARSDGASPSDGGLRALKLGDDLAKEFKVLRDAVLKKLGLALVFRRREVDAAGRIKVAVEVGGVRFLDSNLHPIAAPGRVPGPVVHEVTRLLVGSRRLKLQSRDSLNLITVRPEARSADSTSDDDVDELKRALALLEGEAANLARILTTEDRVRKWYLKQISKASKDVMQEYRSGRLGALDAVRQAHGLRGQIVQDARNRGTALGRAIAIKLKKDNPPLRFFEDRNAIQLFEKPFADLNRQQQIKVWELTVIKSGVDRSLISKLVKVGGHVGRGLWVATLAMVAYSVIEAENKAREAARQSVTIGGGIAGGAAGGAVAGLLCGPGAPICATAGVVIGGIVGALVLTWGLTLCFRNDKIEWRQLAGMSGCSCSADESDQRFRAYAAVGAIAVLGRPRSSIRCPRASSTKRPAA
jgi:hypothetical protein